MPQSTFLAHPSEEMIEEYAFNRLSEREAAFFVEHLFLCPACQERVSAADEYIRLMKTAARAFRGESRHVFGRRTLWAGMAAGIAGAIAVWIIPQAPSGPPQRVELLAYRGGDGMPHAAAGRRIELAVDVSDLSPSATYRLQVVDATGREEWGGSAEASGVALSIQISKRLSQGIHWVRLYSDGGELLREFGLRVD